MKIILFLFGVFYLSFSSGQNIPYRIDTSAAANTSFHLIDNAPAISITGNANKAEQKNFSVPENNISLFSSKEEVIRYCNEKNIRISVYTRQDGDNDKKIQSIFITADTVPMFETKEEFQKYCNEQKIADTLKVSK